MKDLRNGKTLIIFSQDLMAIGNGFMKSRRPLVNLFHSLPDQAKKKQMPQGNPEMQSKFCRNDGRLVYGARRRTPYSSGRRPCRHRTHWAVRTPDFLVVFFIGIFLSFRPQRSGVEKSHHSMAQAALWHEISRLCVSIELTTFIPTMAYRPTRNDGCRAAYSHFRR